MAFSDFVIFFPDFIEKKYFEINTGPNRRIMCKIQNQFETVRMKIFQMVKNLPFDFIRVKINKIERTINF